MPQSACQTEVLWAALPFLASLQAHGLLRCRSCQHGRIGGNIKCHAWCLHTTYVCAAGQNQVQSPPPVCISICPRSQTSLSDAPAVCLQSGSVLLDGVSLPAMDHAWLHRQVAIVSQEPVLFAESIFYNIAFGADRGEDSVSLAQVDSMCTPCHRPLANCTPARSFCLIDPLAFAPRSCSILSVLQGGSFICQSPKLGCICTRYASTLHVLTLDILDVIC